jgi:hypothetical protein
MGRSPSTFDLGCVVVTDEGQRFDDPRCVAHSHSERGSPTLSWLSAKMDTLTHRRLEGRGTSREARFLGSYTKKYPQGCFVAVVVDFIVMDFGDVGQGTEA